MNGKLSLAIAAALVTSGSSAIWAQAPGAQPPAEPGFEVSLTPDKIIYQQNDPIVFTIITAETCKLTLTLVDAGGQQAVLFPNQIESDDLVEANKEFRVGDGKVAYKLREKGRQIVTATCKTTNGSLGTTRLRVDVD